MYTAEPEFQLTDEEFFLIRDFVYECSGIFIREDHKDFIRIRLSRRVMLKQMNNFKDYYYYLRYDQNREEEVQIMLDILATHETYFFRESYQLKAFSEEILPEIRERKLASGTQRLRIWSAGCSTGEEPYSIAMLILEQKEFKEWNVEIVGSDISRRVLQSARRGIYRPTSMRSTDKIFIRKYFEKQDEQYRIKDEVKRIVSFVHLNLLEEQRMALLGRVDIILCRNVLIYFDDKARKKVIGNFYGHLLDEGFLLLGHAESLINLSTSFALRHLKNDLVYQKPSHPQLTSASDEKEASSEDNLHAESSCSS